MIIRCLSILAIVPTLLCVHLAMFRLWYEGDLRKAFVVQENVHGGDVRLAVRLARASSGTSPPLDGSQQAGGVALLFMLKERLEYIDAWRLWLDPGAQRTSAQDRSPRVSLYFHLANSSGPGAAASVALLRELPGFRQVVGTVPTDWCELMAAEVALVQAALADDPSATMFVLLPHDAVPLAPMGAVLDALLRPEERGAPLSRICLAGIRGLEVPSECPHAVEPHWSRKLTVKHHQWVALSATHARRLVDARALAAAAALFHAGFLGEPLCSDEVLPLLALAVPEGLLQEVAAGGPLPEFRDLPLYRSIVRGMPALEAGLRELGAAAECVTYAPWLGCHLAPAGKGKWAVSPVEGAGLAPARRDEVIQELAGHGVLFGRKLGLGGGSAAAHVALVGERARGGLPREAPRRLLPTAGVQPTLGVRLRWALSEMEARVPLSLQVGAAVALGSLCGWAVVAGGGLPRLWMANLLAVAVAGHFVVFALSIVLFDTYSLLQPFRASSNPWAHDVEM